MKLTAHQIGRIALHCEDTYKKFPVPEPDLNEQGVKEPPKGESTMQPWSAT